MFPIPFEITTEMGELQIAEMMGWPVWEWSSPDRPSRGDHTPFAVTQALLHKTVQPKGIPNTELLPTQAGLVLLIRLTGLDLTGGSPVLAEIAIGPSIGDLLATQTPCDVQNGIFNPSIIPFVGYQLHLEIDSAVERIPAGIPIAVYEVASVADPKSLLAEEPLVDLDLPLVGNLPRRINRDLAVFAVAL